MLPPGWRKVLANPASRKVMLLTINLFGDRITRPDFFKEFTQSAHIATQPGAFCLSTAPGTHVFDTRTGRTIPFWPWLQDWPTPDLHFAPQDRRAEVTQIQTTVLPDASLAARLAQIGGYGATMRLDLWSDGIPLEHVWPLMAGPILTPPAYSRAAGPVTLTLTDGEPYRAVDFPPGMITAVDFPLAALAVVDRTPRQVVIGPLPERVPLVPIDQDGRQYYLCDPPMTQNPNRVQKDGVELGPGGWRFSTVTSPAGLRYTMLQFDKSTSQLTTGVGNSISCSGGVGLVDQDAISFLLDYANIAVAPAGRQRLRNLQRDFPLAILVNKSGDTLSLVRSLLAQTGYALTYLQGRADVIELLADTPQYHLGLGNGLLARLVQQEDPTPETSVFNAFVIQCGRDAFASTAVEGLPLKTIRRNADEGSPEIRSLCSRSERAGFGRRQLTVQANDLAVLLDENFNPVSSPGGDRLADLLPRLQAFPHVPHAYTADWLTGMPLQMNDRVFLTDPTQNFSAKPTRVVRWRLPATGPEVTFQTEDQ